MIIEVFERLDEGEELLGRWEELAVDTSRVVPINALVGNLQPLQSVPDLIAALRPIAAFDPREIDSFFARDVQALVDGQLKTAAIAVPHHVALRVALEGIVRKYGAQLDALIRIG